MRTPRKAVVGEHRTDTPFTAYSFSGSAHMQLREEVARRRTFAIISHPDAGKTTLTEKLLLFAGAIQIAGSVKARKATRHATSDWMEIEKQRGISVASSVMQMEYRDCVINLLDTPGHQDFSEDTYRVLTAVDAALMVIDAANGVEAQTLRLLEVCRARNIPIITFVNKMDREVREPLALTDEIERTLGMAPVPFTWPVGMGKRFHGVFDIRRDCMRVFRAGEDRLTDDDELIEGLSNPASVSRFGVEFEQARRDIELVQAVSPAFERGQFLAAQQTPVFFGSAVNNFGVREALDALVEPARRGAGRVAILRCRLQDPGEHGSRAPRSHRVRQDLLGAFRARHAPAGVPHGQGGSHRSRRFVSVAAA